MNNTQNNTQPNNNNTAPATRSGFSPRPHSSGPRPLYGNSRPQSNFRPKQSLEHSLELLARSTGPIPGTPTNIPAQGHQKMNFRPDRKRFNDRGPRSGPRDNNQEKSYEKKPDVIPPLADGDIRIIPLGGVEQIGQNMTMVEYKDQIIVIDAGIQFKDAKTPGIQYIIPNTSYLEERKHLIKGLAITHGHLDHIGGIPYVMEKLGNPPIYTREFGALLIKKRQEEFPHLPPLDIRIIEKDDGSIRVSDDLKIKFFGLTHAIPDSTGVIVETPHGDIVSTGDVRVENIEGVPVPHEVEQYKFFKDRNVLLMTMDSTGIPMPGWSLAESIVIKTVDEIIRENKGRLFIGTFASQVERIIEFIQSAKRYGRYVVIEGRAMKTNVAIVKHLNLTNLDHVIPVEDMHKYPPNKIMILATGAQGEQYALLDRVADGTHKYIKLSEHDTIIFSSSVIPGNERTVEGLKDRLYKFDPKVITYADTQVHSSGHGKRGELEWLHKQIQYKFFMPIHGSHYRLKMHRDLAMGLGIAKDNIIVPENGAVIEIRENGTKIVKLDVRAPHDLIIIDGTYVGPAHQVVLRDRQVLSEEGIFTVIVTLDQRTHMLKKSPDISSRGFIYLRDNQELLHKVRGLAKKIVETGVEGGKPLDISNVKDLLSDKIQKFLFQKTGKKPIVTAVVIAL
jgi:ribonuclease J